MKVYSPSIIENLIVSGSSSFTGSLNVQGTISASSLTGTITTAETASYVEFTNVDGLTSFSSSVDSRLSAQEEFSSSLDATFATDAELSSLSSSLDTRISAQESFSSSLDATFATDAELSSLSSSVDSRLGTSESDIDALETRAGLLESATASLDGRLDAVESFTSSIDTTIKTKLDADNVLSGSSQVQLSDVTGTTFAAADFTFPQDLTVQGTLTAQQFNTEHISSSIIYDSGSTKFGDSADDIHSFTGSLNVVGHASASAFSGSFNGDGVALTNVTGSYVEFDNVQGLTSFSSSVDTRLDTAESDIDALETRAGLLESATSSLDARLDSVETTTASFGGRLSAIETVTSSLDTRVTDLENFSSSLDTTFATDAQLSAVSSSFDVRVSAQEDFSSSLDATFATDAQLSAVSSSFNTRVGTAESDIDALETRAGLLESATSSLDARLDAVETTTSSLNTRVTDLENFSSSLDTTFATDAEVSSLSSSLDTRISAQESFSSSLDATFATDAQLSAVSSSFNTRVGTVESDLNSISSSFDTRVGTAETDISALETRAGLLESATASLDGRLDAVESFTSSIDTTIKTKLDVEGVLSASSQVNHDSTTGFVANEHIDHSTVSISAGTGLTGGGTIAASRTINVVSANNGIVANADNIELATASSTFTGGVKSKLNADGVVSSSAQIDHDATTNFSADEHFTQANITTVGTVTSGNVTAILPAGSVSASSQVSHDSTTGFVSDEHIAHSGVSITAGNGLTGGGTIAASRTINVASANNGITVNADNIELATASSTFTDGVKSKLNTDNVVSSSAQIDHDATTNYSAAEHFTQANITTVGTVTSGNVNAILPTGVVSASSQVNITGTTNYNLLPTLAGTNTLTGVNTFSNTTDSTAYTNGAVVVAGGVGIGKNLNVSGSVTVNGLLTAVSTSFQYVTSSAYTIGTSRIFLNDDDNVRFAGLSIYDSGSASPSTASIFWDSLNHHFIYENISGQPYNSAIIIAGPKNTGTLGDEAELTTNRVPVASGGDHIDTDPSISPLRIDGGDFHVESDTVVTGSVSATTFSGTFAGGVVSASSQVNHDSTTGFVSDEHIAHSGVSITAGNGLTGGGTIAASRTINVASANNGITVNADNIELATASSTFTDGVKSKLNTDGVFSGSSQVTYSGISGIPVGIISASSQVSHDSTTGFVSDEHVAHSGVSITAGNGLTGGGTIAASRTINVASANNGITVNADNIELNTASSTFTTGVKSKLDADTVVSSSAQVNHDSTTGFVANEHVDHSGVVITAGTGLSGGGTITGSMTISHADTSTQASVNNSGRTFIQDITLDDYGHVTAITSATDADTFVGTVTSVGVTAGSGLTGGGTVTTSGTVTLNIGAGTGIDVAADAISVDVSDFMTNGSNNRVVTATGTDGMNAESGLTYDGSTLAVTGAVTATGEITAYFSDARLKNFHGTIENALDKINTLNGYYFTENEVAKSLGYNNDKMQIGVSAQEVQAVLPEIVTEAPIDAQYLTVRYEKIVPLLIEAIKELKAELDEVKKNCNTSSN